MKSRNAESAISETAFDIHAALGVLRRPPVVLCIGSDRVTGDCIGPLVGHLLSARDLDCEVLGTPRSISPTPSSPLSAATQAEK